MSVLVLGAGFMGQAIAGELARRGCIVHVFDTDPQRTALVHNAVQKGFVGPTNGDSGLSAAAHQFAALYASSGSHGQTADAELMSQRDMTEALGRITVSLNTDLAAFVRATNPPVQLVFEAVVEDMQVKQNVLKHLDQMFADRPEVVFCSNTINFNIDSITATMEHHRERVVGVRFLSPVYFIPRVEVSLGRDFTSTNAFVSVWNALQRLGFAPFLFHYAPRAERLKLSAEEVATLLASYRHVFQRKKAASGTAPAEDRQECRYGARCAFINDRLHRKFYEHKERPRAPCRWGGLCTRTDDNEHRQHLAHPPACSRDPCTKLHFYDHRMNFAHPPVACRYQSHCRELHNKEHTLLFLHPSSTGRPVGHPRAAQPAATTAATATVTVAATAALPVVAADPSPEGGHDAAAAEAEVEAEKEEEEEANEEQQEEEGSDECIICFDAAKDALLYPCGHVALCLPCGQRIKGEGGTCPICRSRIEGVVKMYFA